MQLGQGEVYFRLTPLKRVMAAIVVAAALLAVPAAPAIAGDELVRRLQIALNKASCHTGTPDGFWGQQTAKGLAAFNDISGRDLARPIDETDLKAVEGAGVICPFAIPQDARVLSRLEEDRGNNVRAPEFRADGTERFFLRPGECNDGEKAQSDVSSKGVLTNDCDRGRQRSEMRSASRAQTGDRVIYAWDIFVPADFASSASDDHLIVAQIHNGRGPTTTFSLSETDGYFINGQSCFGTDGFGEWHSVALRVAWSDVRKKNLRDVTPGIFEVWCDGERVFERSGRPNIRPGDKHRFKYGLYHAMDFPASDKVEVLFRNVRIMGW